MSSKQYLLRLKIDSVKIGKFFKKLIWFLKNYVIHLIMHGKFWHFVDKLLVVEDDLVISLSIDYPINKNYYFL